MTLTETIDEIRKGLIEKIYRDEAAIAQGVLVKLLNVLDVPIFDTQILIPEYSTANGRVDYALCKSPLKPAVFIEVKRVGNIDGSAERQLFKYAFDEGVQEVVLTDGKEWHFFYPGGEGHFGERRACRLDLVEDDTAEIATRLERYLQYEAVCSGEAVKAIKRDYNIVIGLPDTWNQLLEQPDEMSEMLTEVIAEKVEMQYGEKPTHDQVLGFLRSLKPRILQPRTKPPTALASLLTVEGKKRRKSASRLAVKMPDGKRIEHKHGKYTFLEVVKALGVERCAPHCPNAITADLDTFTESKQKEMEEIDGFYVFLGNSSETMKRYLENIACELGEPLIVKTPEKQ